MKSTNWKKLILPNIPYVFIALFATKLGQACRLTEGADLSERILHLLDGFSAAFQTAAPSFHPFDLCFGIAAAAGIRLAVYIKGKNAKKYRKNMEYGSARWGTAEDIKPFIDPVFENNILLTQTERLMMSNRPKNPKDARNKNVLVIGGSGSGKTRFFIKPNLMQMHSSYVVTDPKGTLILETGKMLQQNGYKIKIFNTINFKKSMHYNPFAYIHSEKDILKLVTCLIANTKGEGKGGDDFWLKAETLLYTAIIGYIYYKAPPEEQNFATLVEFINAFQIVMTQFREVSRRQRQGHGFKLGAGEPLLSLGFEVCRDGHIVPGVGGPDPAELIHCVLRKHIVLPIIDGGNVHPLFQGFNLRFALQGRTQRNQCRHHILCGGGFGVVQQIQSELNGLGAVAAVLLDADPIQNQLVTHMTQAKITAQAVHQLLPDGFQCVFVVGAAVKAVVGVSDGDIAQLDLLARLHLAVVDTAKCLLPKSQSMPSFVLPKRSGGSC